MTNHVSIRFNYPLSKNPYYRGTYHVVNVSQDNSAIKLVLQVYGRSQQFDYTVPIDLRNYDTQTFLTAVSEWTLAVDKITYDFTNLVDKDIMITWQDYVNNVGDVYTNIRDVYVFPDDTPANNEGVNDNGRN